MKRNHSIDTLRTIATLMVILIHVSGEYVLIGKNTQTFDTSFWIGNMVDSFSRICIPLFVLISGMFLGGRKETFSQFYQKRTNRILIPLIAWSIIYSVYKIGVSYNPDHSIDFRPLFNSLISGTPFYHMWYLFMIIGLYLVTPFLNNAIAHVSRNTFWKIAVLLLLFGMVNSSYDNIFNSKDFFILWFVNFLGYFLLGYLMKDSIKRISPLTLLSVYLISSIIIGVLAPFTIKNYDNIFFYGSITPFVIIGSLSIYKLFLQLKLKENSLSKIAHLTLGIYLIHAGVLDVLNAGLRQFSMENIKSPIIGIPLKFGITFFISLVSAWIISKIKYLRRII